MKNLQKYISPKKIVNSLKLAFVLLIGFAAIYAFAVAPIVDKNERIACHLGAANEANLFGDSVLEQNQANQELSQEEIAQQVNVLVNQRYETNYVLCMRNKGL